MARTKAKSKRAKPVKARPVKAKAVKAGATARNATVFRQPFATAKAWGKRASQQPIAALQNGFSSLMSYFK